MSDQEIFDRHTELLLEAVRKRRIIERDPSYSDPSISSDSLIDAYIDAVNLLVTERGFKDSELTATLFATIQNQAFLKKCEDHLERLLNALIEHKQRREQNSGAQIYYRLAANVQHMETSTADAYAKALLNIGQNSEIEQAFLNGLMDRMSDDCLLLLVKTVAEKAQGDDRSSSWQPLIYAITRSDCNNATVRGLTSYVEAGPPVSSGNPDSKIKAFFIGSEVDDREFVGMQINGRFFHGESPFDKARGWCNTREANPVDAMPYDWDTIRLSILEIETMLHQPDFTWDINQ